MTSSQSNRTAIIYYRSSNGPGGLSPQIDDIAAHCAKQQTTIIATYSDEWNDTPPFNRPGLAKLITDLDAGRLFARLLVTDSESMISEDVREVFAVNQALRRYRMKLDTVHVADNPIARLAKIMNGE